VIYDAFGNIQNSPTEIDQFFHFTGRPLDEDTGLQNNLNRWYDGTTGKWLSEDPIGFGGGDANLSRYVENAPTMALDPNGQSILAKAGRRAYQRLTRTVKERALSKFFQVHHKISREIFAKHKKWLNYLGFDIDDSINTITLPNKMGRILGLGGKRSLHQGAPLQSYENRVRDGLERIRATSDELFDTQGKDVAENWARQQLVKFQRELQQGLRKGDIHVQGYDMLPDGTKVKIALGAGIFILPPQRTLQETIDFLDRGTFTHWTGDEGAMGWVGFALDCFNPIDDLKFVAELVSDSFDAPRHLDPGRDNWQFDWEAIDDAVGKFKDLFDRGIKYLLSFDVSLMIIDDYDGSHLFVVATKPGRRVSAGELFLDYHRGGYTAAEVLASGGPQRAVRLRGVRRDGALVFEGVRPGDAQRFRGGMVIEDWKTKAKLYRVNVVDYWRGILGELPALMEE